VVLLRRRDPENPQGHLWDAAGYNYAAYVTNLDWTPADIVAFYDKRADMEKAIHELKEDFGIDRIASSQFGANAADLESKILAFNLLVLYQAKRSVGQSAGGLRRFGGASSPSPGSSFVRPASGCSNSPPLAPPPRRCVASACTLPPSDRSHAIAPLGP
jgi:hypothetical protein